MSIHIPSFASVAGYDILPHRFFLHAKNMNKVNINIDESMKKHTLSSLCLQSLGSMNLDTIRQLRKTPVGKIIIYKTVLGNKESFLRDGLGAAEDLSGNRNHLTPFPLPPIVEKTDYALCYNDVLGAFHGTCRFDLGDYISNKNFDFTSFNLFKKHIYKSRFNNFKWMGGGETSIQKFFKQYVNLSNTQNRILPALLLETAFMFSESLNYNWAARSDVLRMIDRLDPSNIFVADDKVMINGKKSFFRTKPINFFKNIVKFTKWGHGDPVLSRPKNIKVNPAETTVSENKDIMFKFLDKLNVDIFKKYMSKSRKAHIRFNILKACTYSSNKKNEECLDWVCNSKNPEKYKDISIKHNCPTSIINRASNYDNQKMSRTDVSAYRRVYGGYYGSARCYFGPTKLSEVDQRSVFLFLFKTNKIISRKVYTTMCSNMLSYDLFSLNIYRTLMDSGLPQSYFKSGSHASAGYLDSPWFQKKISNDKKIRCYLPYNHLINSMPYQFLTFLNKGAMMAFGAHQFYDCLNNDREDFSGDVASRKPSLAGIYIY